MPARPTRVLLADDHQVVREGLRLLLDGELDLVVVGEASDGNEAVVLAQQLDVDVVVMDVEMRGASGIQATRRLARLLPRAAVVVLSMHEDAATVDRAIEAGARGYVVKGRGIDSLCEAIHAVRRGEIYLSPDLRDRVPGRLPAVKRAEDAPLTDRERGVLRLIADGLTGPQIAGRLGLSPKTIENHRARIMDKLDIHTTAGLVRYALRTGIAD